MSEVQRRTSPSPSRPPASLLARHFLSDELPESLRPTPESHRLQVAVIWGNDQLIEVKDVIPGQPFTLGSKDASVEVYQNLHTPGPLPFVREEKDGSHRLFLPESASPTVFRQGEHVAIETLMKSGRAERVDLPVKGVQCRLDINERATMKFGDLQVVARFTKPETFKTRSFMERMDVGFASTVVILAITAVFGSAMMRMAPSFALSEEDSLAKAKQITSIFKPVVEKPPPPKDAGVQAPRDREGQIGRKDRPHQVAAPPKVSATDTHAKNVAIVKDKGLLKFLGGSGAAENVFGAANAIDGLEKSLGNVRGAGAVADNGGLEGLGARGNGSGGGGHGITIGGLNRGPEDGVGGGRRGGFEIPGVKKVHVPVSRPEVAGISDSYREEIARVIRRHWNEIKYCYEKELQKDPNLDGKVAVTFDIGPVGVVTQAMVREATLESQDAQSCILASVRRWGFPPPPAGVVTVNYPFLFSAAR